MHQRMLRVLHAHVRNVSSGFFSLNMFFCPILYWDEKNLWHKVEVISYFIDMDPIKHISISFLQK